jgi:hypothetical protein
VHGVVGLSGLTFALASGWFFLFSSNLPCQVQKILKEGLLSLWPPYNPPRKERAKSPRPPPPKIPWSPYQRILWPPFPKIRTLRESVKKYQDQGNLERCYKRTGTKSVGATQKVRSQNTHLQQKGEWASLFS